MAEFIYPSRRGHTYCVTSDKPVTVTGVDVSGATVTLLSSDGSRAQEYYTAVSDQVTVVSDEQPSIAPAFNVAPDRADSGGGGSYTPNRVTTYAGAYDGSPITASNGTILVLAGLDGLATADLSGLTVAEVAGAYATAEVYIPTMVAPPATQSWSPSLIWVNGESPPELLANSNYCISLRRVGSLLYARLVYKSTLVGVRAIGESYVDTGIVPQYGYSVDMSVYNPVLSGTVVCGVFENSKGNACRITRSTSTIYIHSYMSAGTYSTVIVADDNATVTMTSETTIINDVSKATTASDIEFTRPVYLFCENRGGAPTFYASDQAYIKSWDYEFGDTKIQLRPKIIDGAARLVDILTGNIPQHIGEFEPVYE